MRLRPALISLAVLAPLVAPFGIVGSSALAPDGAGATAAEGSIVPTEERVLPRTLGGRSALRAAGEDLPEIAALNGRTPTELRELLLRDPTLVLTTSGRLAYRDLLGERSDPTSSPRTAVFPTSETFRLHSRPGSQRTIYLDFDGATSYGDFWDTSAGTIAGYSLDSDPGFNADEHAVIQEVWLRVAEDYAPFDVDVTTEDPGEAAITRSGLADQVFGTRAQITNDEQAHADLCGSRFCTGIAYIGVFDEPVVHARLQPAWTFTRYFSDASAIAETVSHEVGHNLGLWHHDKAGDSFEGYYGGHANWAPIMGSGSKPVIQWSNGLFAGSLNDQDDLAIMLDSDPKTFEGGLQLVPDEAGGTVGTAAPSVPSGGAVITSRSDVDVFSLGTCNGTITVQALPAPISPNLDIDLAVLDASGVVRGSDNPLSTFGDGVTAGGMGATVTLPVDGPVYARVDGVGNGTPSTGYDDYGSLGRYTLSVSGCDPVEPTASPSPTTSPSPTATTSPSPTATTDPVVTTPGAPLIGTARPGPRGRPFTGKITWSAPTDDGGSALTAYVVLAHKVAKDGTITRTFRSDPLSTSRNRAHLKLRRGLWAFSVIAVNAQGEGAPSGYSRTIRAR